MPRFLGSNTMSLKSEKLILRRFSESSAASFCAMPAKGGIVKLRRSFERYQSIRHSTAPFDYTAALENFLKAVGSSFAPFASRSSSLAQSRNQLGPWPGAGICVESLCSGLIVDIASIMSCGSTSFSATSLIEEANIFMVTRPISVSRAGPPEQLPPSTEYRRLRRRGLCTYVQTASYDNNSQVTREICCVSKRIPPRWARASPTRKALQKGVRGRNRPSGLERQALPSRRLPGSLCPDSNGLGRDPANCPPPHLAPQHGKTGQRGP